MIYGNPASYFKDFCPLCGSRFYGDTPEEVYDLIAKHIDDGTCEKNFRPMEIALHDTGEDLRR
jgi:hypothetical protein